MHDRVIDATGASGPSCPACGTAEPAAPLLRVPLPSVEDLGTVAEARAAIDGLDAALAVLLERRAEVAALVQRLKPVGGFAGRNPDRERAIVDAMAEHAPSLGRDRLAKIMNAVIEAGLDAAGR
ncbi:MULTISPECIES: chorismate mutase [Actinomadura]|jgi:chorismate mutase|uniref:Chorismate mutase n=1 Tax=Actinomadura montaniterrae TaxID=1803903 RepID=A0A6L3VMD4_9ACTN|nr:chorismate mutase [Actinomadura montaniterrae]KAB2368791.1 chorismate mutase [Actinomadura montaniterrae]